MFGVRTRASIWSRSTQGGKARRRRLVIAVLLIEALCLSLAVPAGETPGKGGFPINGLVDWLRPAPDWSAAFLGLPKQQSGKAGATGHQVQADATRAGGGAGRPPGKGIGALDPDTRSVTKPKRSTTPAVAGEHSFNAATSKRIESAASATSDVYANTDGTFTRKAFAAPVNYKAPDGSWKPIDTTLNRDPDGRLRDKANALDVEFAGKAADTTLAALRTSAGNLISYRLEGAADVPGKVDGSTITYSRVLPDTDLVLSSIPNGIKESLVLHSANTATSWVFPLNLGGLTAKVTDDGSVELRDSAGKVAAQIPHGYMTDSNIHPKSGQPEQSTAVAYRIITSNGGPALEVSIDEAWLKDAKRVFPVTVDPTVNEHPSGSTYSDSVYTGNHAGEDTLKIGSWDGVQKTFSFLDFPGFEAEYAGAKVTSATLNLFATWAYDCQVNWFDVNPVTEWWTPGAVRGYPGPKFRGAIGQNKQAARTACTNRSHDVRFGEWMSVGLNPDLFTEWIEGREPNFGLAVTTTPDDKTNWKQFNSVNGPNPPYLKIDYTPNIAPQVDGQQPQSGQTVPTLTPELSVVAHDPDNRPKPLNYNFQVFDKNANRIAESGWINSRSWVVPASANLKWGETYLWTGMAGDGHLPSSNQSFNVFTTPVPQPLITSGLSQNGGHGFEPNAGNYTTSATDAAVPTVGPALTVQRAYNSLDPRTDSAFGVGWSTFVDMKATELPAEDSQAISRVAVRYPNGQEVAFGKNNDGSYSPPPGRFATFTSVAGGGYKLVDKDGTTYTFNVAAVPGTWSIGSIADAAGRTESFTYSGGLPTTVTSASGRSLTLAWSARSGSTMPHVTSVKSDPVKPGDPSTALTWTYSYDGNELTKVCPPTSATDCTTYTHTTATQHPSTVLNAGPQSYWRLAEASGATAVSSALSNGGADNGVYTNVTLGRPGPLAGSTATAAGFNGTSSYVKLPATAIPHASPTSISMWFTMPAGSAGGVLYSYQGNDIAGDANAAGGWTPALYVGTNGKLHGHFWVNDLSKVMSSPAAVNDGKWHHVVLAASGNSQSLYLDGARVGGPVSAARYDTDARNAYIGAGKWAIWPNTSGQVGYFNGTISDVAYFDQQVPASTVAQMYAAGTAVAPLLSTVTRPSGGKSAQVAYDPANGKVSQVTDQNGGAWKAGAPVASGSSQVYVGSVLSGRPADYWRLADAGGATQAANQVNGNRATYSAVTIGDTGGPFDDTTVARFNGTSSYLKLPASDVPNSQPTSVSMWFNMPAGSVAGGVLFGYQGNDIGGDPNAPGAWVPALYVGTNGKLHGHFWIEDIRKIMSSPAPVNDGKWHHVVLAASGNSQSLYLDGARIGGPVNAARIDNSVNNAYIGAGKWSGPWPSTAGPVGYFPGQIAEVAFYKSQLTDPQVSAQFNARAKSAGAPIKTVTVTDPAGKKLSYVYDAMTERKVADVDALGNKTQYGYDVGGFLRTVTDPNGNVTTTEHDVRGNTVSQTTCQNQPGDKCSTIYYTYYPDATTRALSPDPRNDVLLTVRDGRSSSATDNTYLTSYAYDAKGNRTTVTDPLGRVTSTGYTDGTAIAAVDGGAAPAGLPSTLATPGGAKQVVEYFKSGDIAKVTDPAGKVTAFSYDGLGRLLTKTEVTDTFPAGLVTRYSYDGQGRVVTQQEPPVTNRVTGAVHTPVTTVTYDVDGLVTSRAISDPTGGDAPRQVSSTFNEFGQEATSTDAAGKVVRIEYDAYGNPVKETDADGGITTTSYDPEGRLLTSTLLGYTGDPNDPSPATSLVVTSRAYDPAGRLASVTDAMGWVTSYTYTDNGLTAKVTRKDPGTGAVFTQEGNTYDAAGNLVSQVTNDGATTTTYAVDAASRTTSTTLDPNGLRRTTDLTLSADDTVVATRISDGSGTVARTEATYDPMGRVTSRTVFNDGSGRPAGWWKLNETSGSTARDSSTAGRSATLTTGVTWADGAAVFSGNGSAVATSGPVLDTTKSYSVSAWVKANALNNWSGIVGQEAVRNSGFHLQWIPGENRWAFTQVPADVDESPPIRARSTTPASLGVWTHLIGVYDSSTGGMSLYVNGVKEGNATNATPIASNGPLTLGHTKYSASTFDRFNGSISNVQVYQRVISAADASELFANGRAGAALETDRLTTSWAVDKGGLPRSVTDPIGNATNYEYDEAGRAVVTVAPTVATEPGTGGAPVSTRPISYVGYNTFGERSETKDPKGNVTVVEYDAAGRVTATRLPAYTPPGAAQPITPVAKRAYDSLGQLVASTDPLGKETTYRYDQLGRVASVTAPNGGQTKFTYDLLGDQLSVTDPTGAVSTATYDYLGRRLTSTEVVRQDNKNYTTEYRYGPGGWLASVKSPAGVVGSTTYNAAGQPVTVTDGANNVTRYSYDGAGRVVRTTLPDGTDATASYDLAGRTVGASSYDAAGTVLRTQSSAYDANGNPTAVTDARGATTTFTYDATGLLTAQVEPVNGSDSITSTFGYDVAGNRTRFTDGRKNAFLTTYNNWNLPESRIEPATSAYQEAADRTFTYEYDAAGRMVTQRSPGGVRVTNSYDEVGNPIRQAGSGAEVTTADRAFGYDLAGRVTSAAGSAGETTLTYDDRGMPRSISGVAGAASFTYTADGALASRNDAAGTTGFSYDSAGRLATTSNSATGVNLSYAYDNLSQVSSIRYGPGGNTRTFSYDALHRLTADELKTATSAAVAKIAYGYDANDNLTSKTTSGFAGSATNTYTYDLANRLTSWNDGTKTTVYAYDRSGNRVQAGNRTFSYDERNQLQASSDGTTYQYTPRGTLKVTNTGSAKLTTAVDAFGQVTSQASAGSTQQYRYDGFGRVIRDGFAYSGLGNDLASDGANKYTRDPAGDVVGVATPTTKALAWTDLHTDVVGLFTDSGIALTGSATYDPFGKVLATIGMVGSLGYQSEWTDAATGRVNMLARWYNPDTGQFDTRDSASNNPVPDSVNANRFAYANANPLTNTDPTGHWSLSGAWNKAKSGFNRAVNAAAYTVASGWNSFSSAVSAGYNWVKDKVDQGRQWVEQKIDQGRKWVEQKVDQGRKWVAEKANQIKQSAKNAYNTVKQAGKVVAAKYVRVVKQAVNHIKDAYNAAEKWVKDNKDMLIEIAAIAGAVLAGLACTAVTAGAGAVACMVGAAALINLAKDSAQGNIHNWGDAFGSLGTGALQGLAGGVGGIVGGKVAALAVGKLGGLAASVGGRMLSGGVSGGVGDAVTQFASTGRVSWGGVAASAGMGAVFGGFARGGGAKVGGGGGRSGAGRVEEPSPGRGRSSESSAGRCPTEHSFDPETRVLMDGGSSKAIKDVLFDDKVVATDPETGSTELKSVELLHVNHDTDLTDVTVKVGGGEKAGTSTVLHTTAHHPFWDQTAKKWVHAADLVVGHELRTYDGETATVTEVRNFAGGNDMYDLTVKDTHTYYVMAGNTPVLVHNCGDVTVSPAASDWATKGAHVHVGGNEVRVFPNGQGGVGAEPIRLSSGTATPRQVQRVLDCINSCASLRSDLISKASSAMDEMNNGGNWGNTINRGSEMHFLIKALEGIE